MSQVPIMSSALEFDDFSFWNDEEGFGNIDDASQTKLQTYLDEHFECKDMMMSGSYLVLYCRNGVPDVHKRPFTIAGCVAVWLTYDDAFPEMLLGDSASSLTEFMVPEVIWKDLNPWQLPSAETLRAIGDYFPTSVGVTFLNSGLIVELAEQEEEAYAETIEQLLNGVDNACVNLNYHNGPIASTEMVRVEKPKPQPQIIQGQADNTNYVDNKGCRHPGLMLSAGSNTSTSTSAGILVQKGDQKRLTVSFQCWDKEPEQNGESKLSDTSALAGHLAERLRTPDIGLVQLDDSIPFSNQFLNIGNTEAKTLLPSTSIKFGDEFVIDSYPTGRQMLKALGLRVSFSSTDDPENAKMKQNFTLPGGFEHTPPLPGKSISRVQVIYATSAPVMPMLRAGVCGAALIRSYSAGDKDKNRLTYGEVAGFMQYAELRPARGGESQLHCFCEVMDGMIKGGWEVVRGVTGTEGLW